MFKKKDDEIHIGENVALGFEYNSGNNSIWLDNEELLKMVDNVLIFYSFNDSISVNNSFICSGVENPSNLPLMIPS